MKQDYMKQTYREKDSYGDLVIYVQKCDKYKYENPEKPRKPILDLHNPETWKINDIMDAVEDYFY